MSTGRVLLVIALLAGLVGIGMGIISCSGEKVIASNQASGEAFSMVVAMAGKELTIGAPRISPGTSEGEGMVTVIVKNSGQTAISLAEIELVYWDQCWDEGEEYTEQVRVKDLGPGEVQTIFWGHTLVEAETGEEVWEYFSWECKGSLRLRVTKIE